MMQRRDFAHLKMLSIPHLIIIFLVALIVFGPEKLPELARRLGKATAEFKRATESLRSGFEEHMRELEREARVAEIRKQPAENTIGRQQGEMEGVAPATPSEDTAAPDLTAKVENYPTEATVEKTRDGDSKPN